MAAATPIEPKRFRDLMASVRALVTVAGTSCEDRPYGATASSFASPGRQRNSHERKPS